MIKVEWLEIVDKCQASGISIKSWCERNGLKYSQYLYWAKKVKKEKREWVAITVPSTNVTKDVKIYCNKWTITATEGVSMDLLIQVLKAVDSVCC